MARLTPLDALEPSVLTELVRTEVMKLVDEDLWAEGAEEIEKGRELLGSISDRLDDVRDYLEGPDNA